MLKILQISPTYFSEKSIVGGGERYPAALAQELSGHAEVKLISFGTRTSREWLNGVPLHLYRARLLRGSALNPFSLGFLPECFDADVLHGHQICTMVSDQICLIGRMLGKKVFLTDHGGGGEVILHKRMPWIHDRVSVVLQSEFTRKFITKRLQGKAAVVKGGVDTSKYCPNSQVKKDGSILFVGRILPHKGVNYLLDAFGQLNRKDLTLRIVGKIYDQSYYDDLKKSAENLKVEFLHSATDEEIIRFYRQAQITVLPSVHTDIYGRFSGAPELMGFTLLESQACGTPVLCTDAGAMPEFIKNGSSGWLVRQNSADDLAEHLKTVLQLSLVQYEAMSREAVIWASSFDWRNVALAHLDLYENANV